MIRSELKFRDQAAAFQEVDEEIGAPLRGALRSTQQPPMEKVLTRLLNEIAVRTDLLILVLNDYHLLKETAVLGAMGFLLDHKPPQLHVVLTTREDPDLPLARLRARDQVTEARAEDLRFTQEEADIFPRGVMGLALSEQDVKITFGATQDAAAVAETSPDGKEIVINSSYANMSDYELAATLVQEGTHSLNSHPFDTPGVGPLMNQWYNEVANAVYQSYPYPEEYSAFRAEADFWRDVRGGQPPSAMEDDVVSLIFDSSGNPRSRDVVYQELHNNYGY